MVPISSLQHADSPRIQGENAEHIRALAEAGTDLPPILIHRETMRVIDGMHRLQAAILNGRREIKARYFEGTETDAFVAGVTANIRHGLPLSRVDREAAAERILGSHPQWSDRAIGEAVGLASTTVARIRGRSTDKDAQQDIRVGKDGRCRPINGAAGRRLAEQLFGTRPDASLREIAEMAGISPTTAKDVRDRLQRGDDPVPARLTLAEQKNETTPLHNRPRMAIAGRRRPQSRIPAPALLLQKLQRDPSLRLNDDGRLLLRWLNSRSLNPGEREGFENKIPSHCIPLIADLALGMAEEWAQFAEVLKQREHSESA